MTAKTLWRLRLKTQLNQAGHLLNLAWQTVLSLVKVVIFYKPPLHLAPATHPTAVILGNGPSLSTSLAQAFDYISRQELFVVNGFAHAEVYTRLKPANYVMTDYLLWEYTPELVKQDDRGLDYTNLASLPDVLIAKTTWPLTLYIPDLAKGKERIEKIALKNPLITIQYINMVVVDGFSWFKHWVYRRGLGMPQVQNVLIACIFLAINRKFKEVFILGADHSWPHNIKLRNDNTLERVDVHFFTSQADVKPHRLLGNSTDSTISMAEFFFVLSKLFNGYRWINEYAVHRGVEVRNASAETLIDAFPRYSMSNGHPTSLLDIPTLD